MFPNENRELSAGCTEDRRVGGCTKRRYGGLRKRAGRAAENSSPPARPFPQSSLQCSPPPCLNVQPTGCPIVQPAGPPFCAARQTAENSCFSFGNTALQRARPAGPSFSHSVLSIMIMILIFYCGLMVHITDTRAQKVVSYTSAHITETVFAHDQHWEEQSSLSSPQLYRHSEKHRKWITIQ